MLPEHADDHLRRSSENGAETFLVLERFSLTCIDVVTPSALVP
jgi:hypothetical protein